MRITLKSNTAILVFANSAQKEASIKTFKASEHLFSELNRHVLATVEATGLPYFQFSEVNQVGADFGERFTNAIDSVYQLGFNQVISIGNDTPHLRAIHILDAAKQLEENDVVLGPSKDGGFYLLGLRKSHFSKQQFLKLPWQTSHLNRSISRLLLDANTTVSYLEQLADIDVLSDVKFVLDSFKSLSRTLRKALQSYRSVESSFFKDFFGIFQQFILDLQFNKGSPSLFQI